MASPSLDAVEGAEAAVAAVELHVDEAFGQRAHRLEETQLGEPAEQRPRKLGGLPVLVDDGQDLLVDEAAGGQEAFVVVVRELVAEAEVVSGESGHGFQEA